jgi:FkbM family methyltransferase
MSYSQGDEEQYILQAVGKRKGRFLDIGAWHPKNLSNTRALYERGWSGLLIEPSPEPFLVLLREYGNDDRIQLLCGAVGVNNAITRFHASSDALTTSSDASYERWKEVGGFYGSFYAPALSIPAILNRFGAFDFVSIDAEGSSVDLFHALLATSMRPDCICVEYDLRNEECIEAGARGGYKALYVSSENVVFGL